MTFMNDYDIDDALQRWESHPVLGPASQTLDNLRRWTDNHSDGWGVWKPPMRAARKLMTLIYGDGTLKYMGQVDRLDATPEALKAALIPVKSFRTTQKADFEIIEKLPESVEDVIADSNKADRSERSDYVTEQVSLWIQNDSDYIWFARNLLENTGLQSMTEHLTLVIQQAKPHTAPWHVKQELAPNDFARVDWQQVADDIKEEG